MGIKIVAKKNTAAKVQTVNVKAKAAEVKKAPSNEIFVSTYTWTDGKGVDHDMVSIAGSEEALQKPGRSFNLSVNNVRRVLSAAKALGLA